MKNPFDEIDTFTEEIEKSQTKINENEWNDLLRTIETEKEIAIHREMVISSNLEIMDNWLTKTKENKIHKKEYIAFKKKEKDKQSYKDLIVLNPEDRIKYTDSLKYSNIVLLPLLCSFVLSCFVSVFACISNLFIFYFNLFQ